ncbi:hypothetical protein H4R20_003299 [Coemansia guatemalensis]|uniref:Phytanoyl-CoA dioxygenase family protein n=1 Tax=Coemansia guatemalensis TaxID=2761395 RepID=A0A9W8HWE4_9FUNG|nr:hypothetical protein H4R20_003299 [Coemansia guatemalensis]
MELTREQVAHYHTYGYVIVAGFLSVAVVAAYRDEAERLTNHCYEQGDVVADWGCIVEPLGCGILDALEVTERTRSTRSGYMDARAQISSDSVAQCTLEKFGRCAQQLLSTGGEQRTYLLNEQYIVKPPYSNAEFAWHQDILYFSSEQRAHSIVSVWTPLDDVSEANGTVLIDPFPDPSRPAIYPSSASGTREPVVATMSAGSALFMDGRVRHCSTGNTSSTFRTVYMPQFSLGAIRAADSDYAALAVPLES